MMWWSGAWRRRSPSCVTRSKTIAGKVDLDGEAVYVRANLDKASMLLADVVGRRD